MDPRLWTPAQLCILREFYANASSLPRGEVKLGALAAQLGKHKTNVCRKARELGLTLAHRPLKQSPSRRKTSTAAELAALRSANAKRTIAERGHPRGALGKHWKRSPGATERSAQWVRNMTPEQRQARKLKSTATKLARYGTAGPAILLATNPYSRCNGGFREDIGLHFRSRWEANYARYLELLKGQGQIRLWRYEAHRFVFDGVQDRPFGYTPDFEVTATDGSIEYHEVKGWLDPQSRVRLERMAAFYPNVPLKVIGEADYSAISKLADSIPNWEHRRPRRARASQLPLFGGSVNEFPAPDRQRPRIEVTIETMEGSRAHPSLFPPSA